MTKDGDALPPPIWVSTPAAMAAMLDRLRGEPAMAVDTESNSLFVYQERVCLVQISVPGVDYLVDALALDDLSGLGPLLSDPAVLKVLHGAEYDLIVLHREFGFVLSNLFDTMWASRILGWPEHGLAALLQPKFGVSLNKKYQRANWGLRPLPPEQLDYARLDTHYLLPLHDIQAQELEARRRWPQAQDRFAKLAQTRWVAKGFDPDGFWQMTGVRALDDVGRGVLCALYRYREQQAQAQNLPPFKVLSNNVLLELSDRRPQDLESLRQVRGVSPRLMRRDGHGLLATIRRGSGQPLSWDERPRPANGAHHAANGRPSTECQARFEALRAWRNAAAEKRGVEPDLVLTNQSLWGIANRNPRSRADLARDDLLARWQVEEFGNDLLGVVKKVS
jgi:ribonuclease D